MDGEEKMTDRLTTKPTATNASFDISDYTSDITSGLTESIRLNYAQDTERKRSCVCANYLRCVFKTRTFNEVSATNLKIEVGPSAGLWDKWGVYYCSSRFGRHAGFNYLYFSLASIFILSQGSVMLDLIHYMRLHGGGAFLVVLFLVYLTVGYPLYLLETTMGQYSGRKPIVMLRLMMPALTGLWPALYLRTIMKAINALGTFIYCASIVFNLFFCTTENFFVYRFIYTESRNPKFSFFTPPPIPKSQQWKDFYMVELSTMLISPIAMLLVLLLNLKLIGEVTKISAAIIVLGLGGYLMVGIARISEAPADSLVYVPLINVLRPNWLAILNGQAWVDALIFVIQTMELGTLVHPYLGSKNFFHYRCYRDGLFLTFLAFFWNVAGCGTILVWLGYCTVNRQQMINTLQHLMGHHGLIVYMIKHVQAELTQEVQGDTLFFNACFYSIVGAAALLAFVVYLFIITDCSFPENGQWMLKVTLMIAISIAFGCLVPVVLLHNDGIRYLTFANYYTHNTWSVFFVVGCYFFAVAFGHDLGKFLHDFFNIIHLKGYQSREHNYNVPRTMRYFILAFLALAMLRQTFARTYPEEGITNYKGNDQYVGIVASALSFLTVIGIGVHYNAKYGVSAFISHKDWYKNKHHANVCFSDFANFKGIPALQDPDAEGDA